VASSPEANANTTPLATITSSAMSMSRDSHAGFNRHWPAPFRWSL
jgi:hypothetical protein